MQLIDSKDQHDSPIGNNSGWSYITFFPKDIEANEVLYDVNRLQSLVVESNYHLPNEVISQHNKVVVTAFPEGDEPLSPLLGLYRLMSLYVRRFVDSQKHPSHGFYGKLGGVYNRAEKGRVLAIYTVNDEALLDIYDSLEKLINEISLQGIRFEIRFSNGLSALPRMLQGFDNQDYRRSGAKHYKITDPNLFTVLLNQAKNDYEKYPFDDSYLR
jgi:hypothetical protein